ncbi:MAG: sugar phosphate isomerase/epimerase [Chitinophagales bacterium]|nr:sugar phosphate isomerase/epimerase [Hyphomicrobiales bacterium]
MAVLTRRNLLAGAAALPLSISSISLLAAAKQPTIRRVLWAANVRSKPLDERIQAAMAGGFTHMSLFPIDIKSWESQGTPLKQIKARLDAAGLKILAIDPYTQWAPRWALPEGYGADYLSFVNFSEADVFRMADGLEAETINCVEPFGVKYETSELIDALGRHTEQAQKRGLKVTLEFMPISGIFDLKPAWEVVKAVNSPTLGLTFDTWHYFRSKPDDALLRTIPGEKIFEIQLADAKQALRGTNLVEDLLRYRMLPGEGEFDIKGVVSTLRDIGAYRSVGPEVFADAMDALPAIEAGRKCGVSLTKFISI